VPFNKISNASLSWCHHQEGGVFMTTRRALVGIAVLLIVGAYIAGYWPEHRRLVQANAQNQSLQVRLDSADARMRLGEVLGLLLRLSDAVAARNFGEAATLSSTYFDEVRQEALKQQADAKVALDRILQSRDDVTAALARTDPAVSTSLREQQLDLRKALGYAIEEQGAADRPFK
jgi:hypothetical protein